MIGTGCNGDAAAPPEQVSSSAAAGRTAMYLDGDPATKLTVRCSLRS